MRCAHCKGAGSVVIGIACARGRGGGSVRIEQTCRYCEGSGQDRACVCGHGFAETHRTPGSECFECMGTPTPCGHFRDARG